MASRATAQSGADPAAVISAYEAARNSRDVDGALALFADDATVTQRSNTFSGKDEIRKFLDGLSARSRFVVVGDRIVAGNRVTWTERAGGQAPGLPMSGSQGQASSGVPNAPTGTFSGFVVTVEAVVQDGKIRSVSYLPSNQPLRADAALDGRAPLPAGFGFGAVMTVLLALLLGSSIGFTRRGTTPSRLRGRLMRDLLVWSSARQ